MQHSHSVKINKIIKFEESNIVETETLVALGQIAPDAVHTPGVFVDCVVPLETLSKEYAVVER